ncbi:MAG: phosphopyruvate hydratase [bacterium]
MTSRIKNIKAREILDSRGNPTLSVRIDVEGGFSGVASVPSGASTGTHEALELRDGNRKRYGGLGVTKAVRNVNTRILGQLVGFDVTRQRALDRELIELDGTENKSKLGANAILAVSLAAARAGAAVRRRPLYAYLRSAFRLSYRGYKMPLPMMNVLNGGRHADWAIDFQECLIIPQQRKFAERVRAGAEIFHALRGILKESGYVTSVGDEGGYAPHLESNEQAFKLIVQAIRKAGYRPGRDVMLGADVAASEFYDEKRRRYELRLDRRSMTAAQMTEMYAGWIKKYPFMTLEDGLAEDDWNNWTEQTRQLGKKLVLVGDDLFVTDVDRLRRGIETGAANAILIKVNQIGSLSETIDAIELAHASGYRTAISHRSGETADTFIADLAVAVNSEFIKTGSLSRSERLEKYNRMMEIESELAA